MNLADGPLPNVSFMLIRNLIMDATSEQDFNRGLYGNTVNQLLFACYNQ